MVKRIATSTFAATMVTLGTLLVLSVAAYVLSVITGAEFTGDVPPTKSELIGLNVMLGLILLGAVNGLSTLIDIFVEIFKLTNEHIKSEG